MNEKDWLDAATTKIRFRPDRKAVRRELEAHLEDLRDASGLGEDAALRAMGDPAGIAEELGRLHSPWLGYLWRLSQLALAGAAAMYCLLVILVWLTGRSYLLPGRDWYDYQHWLGSNVVKCESILEQREIPSDAAVRTGGYTISVDRVTLRKEDYGPEVRWILYIDLDVTFSHWGEPLLLWPAVSGGRADTGPIETGILWNGDVSWGFWQKCVLTIENFPEDAEWVELDFGYGQPRRTLHIDLTEEAET